MRQKSKQCNFGDGIPAFRALPPVPRKRDGFDAVLIVLAVVVACAAAIIGLRFAVLDAEHEAASAPITTEEQ